MSDASKAVFLSYASQDADAARRICDALRSAGIEVWFDQSELRGGDAWDQKIRRQIKECALFMPIISAHTQARPEGYFRLEWKLADRRMDLIGKSKAFLLPVCIDDTRDADADVPDSFVAVQWSRLAAGETDAAFCDRVKSLLAGNAGRGLPTPPDDSVPHRQSAESGVPALPTIWRRPVFRNAAIMAAALCAVVALAIWRPWQKPGSPSAPVARTALNPEAARLLKQARDLYNDPGATHDDFAFAETLVKRAAEVAPDSAQVWAASSLLQHYAFARGFDAKRSARLEQSRALAFRALQLNPNDGEVLFALGLHYYYNDEDEQARTYLEKARAAMPDDPKVQITIARKAPTHLERAERLLEAAAKVSRNTELYYYAGLEFAFGRRLKDAAEWYEKSLSVEPFYRVYVERAGVEYQQSADPVRILAWLEHVPASKRNEPRSVVMRWTAMMLQRDGAGAAAMLQRVPEEYFQDHVFYGPKSFLQAQAEELAGRHDHARELWQSADRNVRERLRETKPGSWFQLYFRAMLALILVGEEQPAEARAAAAECLANKLLPDVWELRIHDFLAHAFVRLGEPGQAAEMLRRSFTKEGLRGLTPAIIAAEQRWDAVRDSPEFQKLLSEARASTQTALPKPPAEFASPKSVAVLAFTNLSGDKDNEYFSDGISEELLTVLQKIPGMRVAARTSAFSFKGKNVTAQEIGEKLGVALVVEGSVQKSGTKVKIIARLSRAATNEELWSRSFGPLELTDVFATQSELAQTILEQLRGHLGSGANDAAAKMALQAQVQAAQKGGTKNAEAHQLYLQGKFFANQASQENYTRAIGYFRRAVELDPSFALAWAALSRTDSLQIISIDTTLKELTERVEQARKAADRALALEPNLAEAHLARYMIQAGYDFDWRGARASLRHALELAPADAVLLAQAGRFGSFVGELEKGLELGRQAVDLDPVNSEIRRSLGRNYSAVGRFKEAAEEQRRALELSPATPIAQMFLAHDLLLQGKPEEALIEAQRENAEWARTTALALIHWALKNSAQADAALARLIEGFSDTGPCQIAEIYAFRGQSDLAFQWLDRAHRLRDGGLREVRTDAFFANLHADPRWPAFLRKMGLADEQLK